MTYAVKELFVTLQGEGAQAGRVAVFLRFAGCNLWSGRAEDRGRGAGGCAAWCDTDFVGTDGSGGGKFAEAGRLAAAVARTWGDRGATKRRGDAHPAEAPALGAGNDRYVVCTGGEPLLQLDPPLIDALHGAGFTIAIETNGTIAVPDGVDWICVSPKPGPPLVVTAGDELKIIYPQPAPGLDPAAHADLGFRHFFVQPLDGPDRAAATAACVAYCLAHPQWRISLQTHKLLGIP